MERQTDRQMERQTDGETDRPSPSKHSSNIKISHSQDYYNNAPLLNTITKDNTHTHLHEVNTHTHDSTHTHTHLHEVNTVTHTPA